MSPVAATSPTGFTVREPLPGIAVVSAAVDAALVQLPPSLQALVLPASWPPQRRQQCLAARALAALALASQEAEILVGRSAEGLPVWPAGMVGSLSHETHLAVAMAATARRRDWLALGVDVEADGALPDNADSVVLCEAERERLAPLAPAAAARAARWLFSAKECVHKALNPLNGAWLEFDEVSIDWSGDLPAQAATWQLRPLSDSARQATQGLQWQGRWWTQQGCIHTLLAMR